MRCFSEKVISAKICSYILPAPGLGPSFPWPSSFTFSQAFQFLCLCWTIPSNQSSRLPFNLIYFPLFCTLYSHLHLCKVNIIQIRGTRQCKPRGLALSYLSLLPTYLQRCLGTVVKRGLKEIKAFYYYVIFKQSGGMVDQESF